MAKPLQESTLLKHVKPLRPYLVSAAGFSFFINILMIAPAIYMLQVFDRAVASRSEGTLLMLTLILVFLLTAMGALDWVRSQIMNRAGEKLDALLAAEVFDATYRSALLTGGRGGTQALSDIAGLRGFLSGPAINAFFDTPWVPVYVVVMFLFHPGFGLLALASVALIGILTLTNQRMTRERVATAASEQGQARNFAGQQLRNAEAIEAMGMMPQVFARWRAHNGRAVSLQAAAADTSGALTAASRALRILLQSLALGLGAYLAINNQISPGMMIAGSIMLGRALAPVDQLVGAWKGWQAARQQFTRLDELLSAMPPRVESLSLPPPQGRLQVEGLRVVPPGGGDLALRGVSFELAAGEQLGIIGPSAAGKSTLARAVLGLWPAQTGEVRLDGASLAQWNREELGPYIGYLPQDVELLTGTVSENIARFGELDSERVVEAARLAGVHQMILRLPNGYDTVVGALGGGLAGGQRQRIGLARALYDKPKLVVLDEPNSNLDDVGEAALRYALQQLRELGSTVLVISHRPNVLACVDKILVLRDGQIADFGAAREIMGKFKQVHPRRPADRGAPGVPGGDAG